MSLASILSAAGFLSVIAGCILILLGIFSKGRGEVETRGFGILFLGPIPIIFGGGKGWKRLLTLISFILLLIFLLIFFLPHLFR